MSEQQVSIMSDLKTYEVKSSKLPPLDFGSETELDPDANRDFKAIRIPFNEYEYRTLEETAKRTGRSKSNLIRWAILKMYQEINNT